MSEITPATPPSGAAPGLNEQGKVTPPAPPSAAPGQVTISAEEFAKLQRDHARVMSFEKRKEFVRKSPPQGTNQEGGEDEEVIKIRQELAAKDTELHRERVSNRVRDLLAKTEYAGLPESTRKLILKNPAMLSEADNLEEAMLDIEDFIREESAGKAVPVTVASKGEQPKGIETPSGVSSSAPTAPNTAGLEDLSQLQGVARSRAALRNAVKKSKGVKG